MPVNQVRPFGDRHARFAAVSGVWVYLDAKKRERASPRSLALGTTVLFSVDLLFCILSR